MSLLRTAALLALTALPLGAREAAWTRLDAANFTILSAVSEKETRAWAVEFEQFHQGLGKILKINDSALQPVTVVLFRSQADMRRYKPLEKGRPAEVDGLFMRSPLGNFIEVAADSEDKQTRQLIFHEGVHWMTNVSDTPLPLWLDEGLAEVFSTFSTEDDLYNYGEALPWHVDLLHHSRMMPLKELLAVQRGSLLYNEGERTSIFYAESWAFVHYLLFSGRLEERAKYNELIHALRARADPDAVFRRVFGADCAAMDARLKDYLNGGSYTISRAKFDRSAVDRSFTVRRALPGEVDLAQCCLLTAVNRPTEARPRLQGVTAKLPGNPIAWEAEGYAAYLEGDYDETDACFRRAANLKSHNYFVYSFLGDAALGLHPGRITRTVASDVRLAVDCYERELQLNPRDAHAYDNVAGNAFSLDPLTPRDAALLLEGVRLFPDDAMAAVGLAVAAMRQGHKDEALVTLRRIAADASDPARDASAYARSILETLERGEAIDRLNDLLRSQDFEEAVATIDQLLRSETNPGNREGLERTRARAEVALKVKRAYHLANAGRLPEAKGLLLEAQAESNDPQMNAQIQALLERIEKAAPPPRGD